MTRNSGCERRDTRAKNQSSPICFIFGGFRANSVIHYSFQGFFLTPNIKKVTAISKSAKTMDFWSICQASSQPERLSSRDIKGDQGILRKSRKIQRIFHHQQPFQTTYYIRMQFKCCFHFIFELNLKSYHHFCGFRTQNSK